MSRQLLNVRASPWVAILSILNVLQAHGRPGSENELIEELFVWD